MTEMTGRPAQSAEVERLLASTDGREALRPYLSHPDPGVRRTAVEAVAERRPDWGYDALCLALLDAADPVRVAAADALRLMEQQLPDQPQLFDFLEQALDSPSVQAREVAVRLLRRTSDASISTFVSAAGDSEPGVRREAVQALADLRAVVENSALADDPSREVRAEVAVALGRLGDERSGLALRRLVLDDDEQVRGAAVVALAAIRPNGSLRTELAD
ncbi:MAG: HEAT repeat domain-containing protein [Nocardioidaceae bacterium]